MPTFYHSAATSDYSQRNHSSVYFPAGTNQATFTVTIRDEGLIEFDEEFYVDLEIPSSAAYRCVTKHSPDNATVIITDDDSECSSIAVSDNENILNVHTYEIECLSILIHSFIH